MAEEEFWACARDGVQPDRGDLTAPPEALPADLAYMLVHRVGLAESEVAAMTKVEAVEHIQRYWLGEGQP